MTRRQYEDILMEATDCGYELVDTTPERNGYPTNLRHAITGFNNWEEAQDFAKENGLDLITIDKRDGWQVWHRGGWATEPFDLYSDYLQRTDVPICYTNDEADEYLEVDFRDALVQQIQDGELCSPDEVRDFCDHCEEIHTAIEDLEDDEFLVVYEDGGFESKPKTSLTDYDDTKHYAIAAIYDDDFADEEDSDDE